MMSNFIHMFARFLKLLPASRARQYVAKVVPATPTSPMQQKQFLVDVSVIYRTDARTGIQRVVRSLLLQLISSPPVGYSVRPVFATATHSYCYADLDVLDYSWKVDSNHSKSVVIQAGDLFLALDLAAHLLPRHQVQILHWKMCGVKIHVLVYDILPLQYPEWFNEKTTRNFKRWIRWMAVYADGAICISNSVKAEVNIWLNVQYGLPPSALHTCTIVLGADIASSAPSSGLPPNAEFLLARLRNTPAVLMVGTVEPRKGYDQALSAFELLWRQRDPTYILIVVGRPGWKTQTLQNSLHAHPELGKRLFWIEDASDEFLNRLYAACRGVLVASRAEGFGLPLIEAALHGAPVLARDIPVFREIGFDDVTYFNSTNPQDLAKAIDDWLSLGNPTSLRRTTKELPTWQLSATQLLSALGLKQAGAAEYADNVVHSNSGRKTINADEAGR
jgi:glycosyltransferase involved in cell wall biosynthesis